MSREADEDAALDECLEECGGSAQEFIGRQMDAAVSDVFANRGVSESRITVPKGTELGQGRTAPGYEWVEIAPGIQRCVRKQE